MLEIRCLHVYLKLHCQMDRFLMFSEVSIKKYCTTHLDIKLAHYF